MPEVTLEEIGAILVLKNQEQFIRDLRGAIHEEERLEHQTKKSATAAKMAGGSFSFLGKGLKAAWAGAKALALGLGVVAVGIGALGVKRIFDVQKAMVQTAAVVKSTGGVAHVTAKQVDTLALSIQRYSGMDRTVVASGANMLLMFTKIRNEAGKGNDVFNQALTLAADLAVRRGMKVQQTSLQLGKALQDPITGLTMLRRVGVIFTKQEQDQIKVMAAHGHMLEAQRVILARVRTEVGGAAAAYGRTVPGMLKRAGEDVKDIAGRIVAPLLSLAVPVLEHIMGLLDKYGPKLSSIGKYISGWVSMAGKIIPGAIKQASAGNVTGAAGILDNLFGGKGKTTAVFAEIIRSIQRVITIGKSLVPILRNAADMIIAGFVVGAKAADRIIKLWSEHTVGVRRALVVLLAVILGYKVVANIWNLGRLAMKLWNSELRKSIAEQGLLNALMDANPIGVIIIGVAALAAGFAYLYFKVGWFHDAVNAVFRFFKNNWPLLLAILTGPFGLAVLFITKHFDTIKRLFKEAINFVIDGWNAIHFKLPSFKGLKVHGHTVIPGWEGPTIDMPNIKRLHDGGMTTSAGMVNIRPDEELVSLPSGATVVPLNHPAVDLSGLQTGEGGTKVIQLVVDGKVLAETVYSNARDRQARG